MNKRACSTRALGSVCLALLLAGCAAPGADLPTTAVADPAGANAATASLRLSGDAYELFARDAPLFTNLPKPLR
ncbi:MAG: hypothetical protein ABIW85_04290, partial [Variovorax sp.]